MAKKNDYYVYVYFDPDTRRPIYVGKGCGYRALAHLKTKDKKSPKYKALKEIRDEGQNPIIQIVQWNLTEDQAFKVEAALVECFGLRHLTNKQSGHGVWKVNADFLGYILNDGILRVKKSGRKRVLLLSLGSLYKAGMSAFELYDAIRGPWYVNWDRVKECDYIVCIVDGYVIEVYQDVQWFRAGSGTRQCACDDCDDGYEFMARRASKVVRNRYVGKQVRGVTYSRDFAYGWVD